MTASVTAPITEPRSRWHGPRDGPLHGPVTAPCTDPVTALARTPSRPLHGPRHGFRRHFTALCRRSRPSGGFARDSPCSVNEAAHFAPGRSRGRHNPSHRRRGGQEEHRRPSARAGAFSWRRRRPPRPSRCDRSRSAEHARRRASRRCRWSGVRTCAERRDDVRHRRRVGGCSAINMDPRMDPPMARS